MAGWIGRLRNEEHSVAMTVGGSQVQLDTRALWAHGRFCRCLVSVAFAPIATPAPQRPRREKPTAAPAMHGTALDRADVLTPDEAGAVADRAAMLLKRHLDNSGLQLSALAWLKAYHVGINGVALSHALESVLCRLLADHAGLCSLPVSAVGMTSAATAFLLMECTATVGYQGPSC